jgi:subtilisin family serine protease
MSLFVRQPKSGGALLLAACVALPLPIAGAPVEEAAKVDPWVLDRLAETGEVEFLVFLAEQADLSFAAGLVSKAEKGRFVFDRLTTTADRTQAGVVDELEARGLDYRRYWVANMVWVRGDAAAVAALAAREDVARLHANPTVQLDAPVSSEATGDGTRAPEGSLEQVGATDFWALGFTGQGAVVAGADTGYDWDHPALLGQYRGWDGASAIHDYNWHDAIHSGGGSCGPNSAEPCDDFGHGTHTMGTMVGDDGGSNQIGVAPGARWIGCRNMNVNAGTPTTYSECFQFFIAPTDLNDENPLPELAPDVVNGSWSCPPSEGCTDPNVLRTVVENTRAAGIFVSQSAGNSGPGCSSVSTPAAIYEASFTVGAVDSLDEIAGFSARGPVTVDGSDRLKPDVSAPGVSIRSSVPGGGYASFNGTSMSAPHVSGLVALLISAQSCLAGDPDGLEQHITATAIPGEVVGQTCGGIPDSQIPNNTYGYGSIRAQEPTSEACSSTIFVDGFESGDTSAWGSILP